LIVTAFSFTLNLWDETALRAFAAANRADAFAAEVFAAVPEAGRATRRADG